MSETTGSAVSAAQSLILKNAISSLKIGLEDYELSQKDPDRILSSIRNVYASLLLFLKEGLCRLSPLDSGEEFIKAKLEPIIKSDGSLGLTGIGNTTIDVEGIQQRYKLLRIKINWKPLISIQQERNNIEHLYSTAQIAVLQSVICEASTFIIEILKKVLDTNPASLLGNVWEQMTAIKNIYEPIKAKCTSSLQHLIDRKFMPVSSIELIKDFSCLYCGSKLIYLHTGPDEPSNNVTVHLKNVDSCELVCFACGTKLPIYSLFESFADDEYSPSTEVLEYTGEAIVKECPECKHNTFIDNHEVNACIFCGHEKMNEFCKVCEAPLPLEQDFEGICEHCEYMLSEP